MDYETDRSLGFHLNITSLMVRGEFSRRIFDLGIAPEQYGILYFIDSHPGLTQSEIAQIIFKNKTTITRLTDALVKKGLLIKEWSKEDRRRQNIKITAEGKKILEETRPIANALSHELNSALTDDELEMLLSILKKIQNLCKSSAYAD